MKWAVKTVKYYCLYKIKILIPLIFMKFLNLDFKTWLCLKYLSGTLQLHGSNAKEDGAVVLTN